MTKNGGSKYDITDHSQLSIRSTLRIIVLPSVISVRKLDIHFFEKWVGSKGIVYFGIVYKQTYVVCNDVRCQSLDGEVWETINCAVYVLRKGIVSLEFTKKKDRN